MGTRGIMGVRVNGQDKLAYNHFDSYPSGLGEQLVSEIRGLIKSKRLEWAKQAATSLVLIDTEIKPTAEQKEKLRFFADLTVSEQSLDDWYCLMRKLQGNLPVTLEAGYMIDSHEFVRDSLFCEWGYILNFDTGTFEVYRGFQKAKHTQGRFADLPKDREDSEYYPIALVAEFPLTAIPKNWAAKVEASVAA